MKLNPSIIRTGIPSFFALSTIAGVVDSHRAPPTDRRSRRRTCAGGRRRGPRDQLRRPPRGGRRLVHRRGGRGHRRARSQRRRQDLDDRAPRGVPPRPTAATAACWTWIRRRDRALALTRWSGSCCRQGGIPTGDPADRGADAVRRVLRRPTRPRRAAALGRPVGPTTHPVPTPLRRGAAAAVARARPGGASVARVPRRAHRGRRPGGPRSDPPGSRRPARRGRVRRAHHPRPRRGAAARRSGRDHRSWARGRRGHTCVAHDRRHRRTTCSSAPHRASTSPPCPLRWAPRVHEIARGEYRVDTAPIPATVAALTSWFAERDLPLADLRAERHRLDDVFRQLTALEPATGRPSGPEHGENRTPRSRPSADVEADGAEDR